MPSASSVVNLLCHNTGSTQKKLKSHLSLGRDLNSRPSDYKSLALPAEPPRRRALCRDELGAIVYDTSGTVFAEFPEYRLYAHPDSDIIIVADHLSGHARTLVQLDDREWVRGLHIESLGCCMDDRVGDDLATSLELVFLDATIPAAVRAHRSRREVVFAAGIAPRSDQVVPAADMSPESRYTHVELLCTVTLKDGCLPSRFL